MLLQIAASLESQSEHPLARAIVEAAKKEKIELCDVTDFQSTTGGGVSGKLAAASPSGGGLDGKTILIGKEKFLTDSNVRFSRRANERSPSLTGKSSKLQSGSP